MEVESGLSILSGCAHQAVQHVYIAQVIGGNLPPGVFDRFGVGIHHQAFHLPGLKLVAQPAGKIADVATQVCKRADVCRQV